MTPRLFLDAAILPAYTMLPERMSSPRASAMILAICLQESRLQHRRQIGGPARGYPQFEMQGGILGVLRHEQTRSHIRIVLDRLNYDHEILTSYVAIEHNDILAAAYSRLLLWTDREPLPEIGQDETSWQYYLRTWRPGKPHRETWNDCYYQGWETVNQWLR